MQAARVRPQKDGRWLESAAQDRKWAEPEIAASQLTFLTLARRGPTLAPLQTTRVLPTSSAISCNVHFSGEHYGLSV
jgi:hypothetical protein